MSIRRGDPFSQTVLQLARLIRPTFFPNDERFLLALPTEPTMPDPRSMKFIEMTGAQLAEIITDSELHIDDLESAGVCETTIVRVNQHGDIEVRRPHKWDIVGGLLGNFEDRVKKSTGLDWA